MPNKTGNLHLQIRAGINSIEVMCLMMLNKVLSQLGMVAPNRHDAFKGMGSNKYFFVEPTTKLCL